MTKQLITHDTLLTPEEAVKHKIFPLGYHVLLRLLRAGEKNKRLGTVGKKKWEKDYIFGMNIGGEKRPVYRVSTKDISDWLDRRRNQNF